MVLYTRHTTDHWAPQWTHAPGSHGTRDPILPARSYWELSTALSSIASARCGAFRSWTPPAAKQRTPSLDGSLSWSGTHAHSSSSAVDHHPPPCSARLLATAVKNSQKVRHKPVANTKSNACFEIRVQKVIHIYTYIHTYIYVCVCILKNRVFV